MVAMYSHFRRGTDSMLIAYHIFKGTASADSLGFERLCGSSAYRIHSSM